MTAPNVASAQPGQRFTDPDGGTWVLMHPDAGMDELPWATFTPGGRLVFHSQEEAEKSGLTELVAETELRRPLDEAQRWASWFAAERDYHQARRSIKEIAVERRLTDLAEARSALAEALRERDEARAVAPVPLDPSNPDDLRRWLEDAHAIEQQHGLFSEMTQYNSPFARLADIAAGLYRERAKQAQDAEDRRLSEAVADEVWSREESAWHIAQKAAQATIERIRAERARASAEGS